MPFDENRLKLFTGLDGIPYLVGEYFDKRNLTAIDTTAVRNDVVVDNCEVNRAIVTINVNNIGFKSDGGLDTVGNRTKQKKLIKMITEYSDHMNRVFSVLRRGMIVRINYRIENMRTGVILKTSSEDIRIVDRNYFVELNSADINDNAVITNFVSTTVSTLNQFTHGSDRMLVRILSVQMFYEALNKNPKSIGLCTNWNDRFSIDYLHPRLNPYLNSLVNPDGCDTIVPTNWWNFNRFYHFDSAGRDIVLHGDDIEDRANCAYLVPCGHVTINRTFEITAGHRVVFKLSIWNNDITMVSDTKKIATTLVDAPQYPYFNKRTYFTKLLKKLLRDMDRDCNDQGVLELLIRIRNLLDSQIADPNAPVTPDPDPVDPNDPTNPGGGTNPDPGTGGIVQPGDTILPLPDSDIDSVVDTLP